MWRTVLVAWLVLPAVARAEALIVRLTGVPAVAVAEPAARWARFGRVDGTFVRLLADVAAPAAAAQAVPPMPAVDPAAGGGPPEVDTGPVTTASLDDLADVDPGPPSDAFRARLREIYGITDEADVAAAWRLFAQEPEGPAEAERISNAVVRLIERTGRPLAGADTGVVAGATAGQVSSAIGVSVRDAPWGAEIGRLPAGAAVTIVPPADGPWYRVQTGSGTGWVCAFWVKGD